MSAFPVPLIEEIRQRCTDVQNLSRDPAVTGYSSDISLKPASLQIAADLLHSKGFFLECMSAVDFSDCFELVYFFNRWDHSPRMCVRTSAAKESIVPSVRTIYSGADWHEREISDLFGLSFDGLNPPTRFLLPESASYHPLLKSFKGKTAGDDVQKYPTAGTAAGISGACVLKSHADFTPANGPFDLRINLDGETVSSVEPLIGFGHRGLEKMAELFSYPDLWQAVGRLDCAGTLPAHLAYAQLIERAAGMQTPERAQAIRVLLVELDRIASHLLWLGTFLESLSPCTLSAECLGERERLLAILHTAGSCFCFGGVTGTFSEEKTRALLDDFIPHFKNKLREYTDRTSGSFSFRKRTEGLGIITRSTALDYGITGPNLRAGGVAFDQRRSEPCAVYSRLDFEIPVEQAGDAHARCRVRIAEMRESLKIAEQLYNRLPKGETRNNESLPQIPKGDYYFAAESARGAFGLHLVSDGSPQAYRLKLCTPSFSNLSALDAITQHCFLDDLNPLMSSLDISITEVDR